MFYYINQLLNQLVRLVETDIGGQALVVAVISVNVSPFLAFSDQTRHLEDT